MSPQVPWISSSALQVHGKANSYKERRMEVAPVAWGWEILVKGHNIAKCMDKTQAHLRLTHPRPHNASTYDNQTSPVMRTWNCQLTTTMHHAHK
jgi:hypothetical protein